MPESGQAICSSLVRYATVVTRRRKSAVRPHVLEHRRHRVAGGLGRGEREQPRVLLALQHPVDQLLQVERRENASVGGVLHGPEKPQHHPEQILVERGYAGLRRGRGHGVARPEHRRAPFQHVAGHLADQRRVDLQHERQERAAEGSLQDLGLEVQVTRQDQVAERVVQVSLAADRHGLAALSHDAQGQRLNLLPRRPGRRGEPVDRQAWPQAGIRAGLGRYRSEFGHQVTAADDARKIPGRHLLSSWASATHQHAPLSMAAPGH